LVTFAGAQVNVTQLHNHYTRNGLYVDPAFTLSAVTNLTRDSNFDGTIPSAAVPAQPLYVEGGPDGRAKVIVAVKTFNTSFLVALDATTGKTIWSDQLGPVVTPPQLCENGSGIRGTPAVDLPSRTVFCEAATPAGHLIYGINVDTGTTNAGWPINVASNATYGSITFTNGLESQRGALAVLGDYVYVPYGSYLDCGSYHGWLVAVQISNPSNVQAWATTAVGGAAWAPAGVASDDGVTPFIATGNTYSTTNWGGGEALIRFQPGAIFSGATQDYWAPTNWVSLDGADKDIGGLGVLMVDVPGATPSQLAAVFGKDGNCYLLNRTNLGGISQPVAQAQLKSSLSCFAPASTYHTADGRTFVIVNLVAGPGGGGGGPLTALTIGASNPPTISVAWQFPKSGSFAPNGSPFITTTDGSNNPVVWVAGTSLQAFDGLNGNQLYSSSGSLPSPDNYISGIVARGRVYFADNGHVYAFTVPRPPIELNNLMILPDGTFQFSFTNTPGLTFTVFASTNLSLPFSEWTRLGAASEISSGQFQFNDPPDARNQARFYRVSGP
jgi:hypothetical protein